MLTPSDISIQMRPDDRTQSLRIEARAEFLQQSFVDQRTREQARINLVAMTVDRILREYWNHFYGEADSLLSRVTSMVYMLEKHVPTYMDEQARRDFDDAVAELNKLRELMGYEEFRRRGQPAGWGGDLSHLSLPAT